VSVSPEGPEQDDFLEDEEQEEYGQRSIFATGWFRAVLVLLVLAVIAVIAVPLIGGWFEPTPPTRVTTKAPEPTKPVEPPPALVPAPATPATPAPGQTPTPATPPASTPSAAAPATPAPAVTVPAPAPPETPAAAPGKAVEKPAAPERTAAATPQTTAKRVATGGGYWVQVGAFKEIRNAEGLARTLRSEGFKVHVAKVTRAEPMHVVRVGGYPDRARAAAAREELQGKGHTGFVTHGPAK
jgi:cell division protein FtsN